MAETVAVPSFWVLAYLLGLFVGTYYMFKSNQSFETTDWKFHLSFFATMLYMMVLTVGLRIHYG